MNLLSLLELLENIFILEEGHDSRCWVPSKDGVFMVASFPQVMSINNTCSRQLIFCASLRLCQECLFSVGLHCGGYILTIDDLRRQNMIIISACLLSLAAEESVDHDLLNCTMTHQVQNSILSWFECSWVLPRGIVELFEAWNSKQDPPKVTLCGGCRFCLLFGRDLEGNEQALL